jgi:tol-pal system protein YbgF
VVETAPVEKQKPEELKEGLKKEGTEIKNVYKEIYATYKQEKFKEAREKFEAFLKDYSENEYSDNARFWIGETYYKEGNYKAAILAYERLLNETPESDKVPGALLKQGMAFYELGEEETGRIILKKLIEKFPDSEQVQVAKKKLGSLKSSQTKEQ